MFHRRHRCPLFVWFNAEIDIISAEWKPGLRTVAGGLVPRERKMRGINPRATTVRDVPRITHRSAGPCAPRKEDARDKPPRYGPRQAEMRTAGTGTGKPATSPRHCRGRVRREYKPAACRGMVWREYKPAALLRDGAAGIQTRGTAAGCERRERGTRRRRQPGLRTVARGLVPRVRKTRGINPRATGQDRPGCERRDLGPGTRQQNGG